MLGICPECELPISDKALSCPHCGFPLKGDSPKRRSSRKRMRLPNGFGQISELKGRNLRNPFRAMVTVGTDESGRPICRTLKPKGYFKTYNEAYAALVEYNRTTFTHSFCDSGLWQCGHTTYSLIANHTPAAIIRRTMPSGDTIHAIRDGRLISSIADRTPRATAEAISVVVTDSLMSSLMFSTLRRSSQSVP